MTRGDIVVSAAKGEYGKARPTVIVQSNAINDFYPSVVLCPLSSDMEGDGPLRPRIEPTPLNGLIRTSSCMVDKIYSQPRSKVGRFVGRLSPADMGRVDAALRLVLDLD